MNNKQPKSPKANGTRSGYVFIGGRIPGPLKAALEECARREDLSVSQMLRRIVSSNSGIKEALRQSRTP